MSVSITFYDCPFTYISRRGSILFLNISVLWKIFYHTLNRSIRF
nr:MAG TPA: hypothetical protein [Caudoviricetes sp.]DAX54536.1 MAG TPA: hypothetical protein [Caudoviricetes sp.]